MGRGHSKGIRDGIEERRRRPGIFFKAMVDDGHMRSISFVRLGIQEVGC